MYVVKFIVKNYIFIKDLNSLKLYLLTK